MFCQSPSQTGIRMGWRVEISGLEEKHASDKADLVSVTEVDTAAEFTAGGTEKELDPVEALRVRYAATDWSRILHSYFDYQAQD